MTTHRRWSEIRSARMKNPKARRGYDAARLADTGRVPNAAGWQDLVVADRGTVRGRARIRGTRIAVSTILGCLAEGMTEDEILAEYPSLSPDGIRAAAAYGATFADEQVGPLPERQRERYIMTMDTTYHRRRVSQDMKDPD